MRLGGLLCVLLLGGCAGNPGAGAAVGGNEVRLRVGMAGGRCTIALKGQPSQFDADTFDFRRWRRRRVAIEFADPHVPYRCVGGLIFALQRARVRRIGFISEPAGPAPTTNAM
jgi:hypothetical protein